MLNCTDLECILHHHHYYAHLHQLQPHLGGRDALSTAPEDVGDGIQSPENDTNSLQSLSYLDPPVDSVYMICGVLIAMVLVGVIIVLLAVTIRSLGDPTTRAPKTGPKIPANAAKKLTRLYLKYKRMVGSNGTMIAIRLVRSKLRKREEHQHSNAVHPEQVQCSALAPAPAPAPASNGSLNLPGAGGIVNQAMTSSTTTVDSCCAGAQSTIAAALGNGCATIERTPETGSTMLYTTSTANGEQFIWQFPPPYPPPNTPPPQYTLYNDQDTLVHGLQSDRQGFAKGFRKNLGGRWRRLVKRKPESETCAIPPELKDQLKTIYVY